MKSATSAHNLDQKSDKPLEQKTALAENWQSTDPILWIIHIEDIAYYECTQLWYHMTVPQDIRNFDDLRHSFQRNSIWYFEVVMGTFSYVRRFSVQTPAFV